MYLWSWLAFTVAIECTLRNSRFKAEQEQRFRQFQAEQKQRLEAFWDNERQRVDEYWRENEIREPKPGPYSLPAGLRRLAHGVPGYGRSVESAEEQIDGV